MRDVTQDFISAAQQSHSGRLFFMVDILFAAPQYFTDLEHEITYLTNTYLPNNGLLDIGDLKETEEMQVNTLDLSISGANTFNFIQPLADNPINKVVNIYMGLLDSSNSLINDPLVYFRGKITGYNLTENPKAGLATVRYSCANQFADFQRTNGRRNNDSSMRYTAPNDGSLAYSSQAIKDVQWGKNQ